MWWPRGCTPTPARGWGQRAPIGAAREGFLGETLSKLRLGGGRVEWGGGGEEKVLGARTGLCRGLGVVDLGQLWSIDTRFWGSV